MKSFLKILFATAATLFVANAIPEIPVLFAVGLVMLYLATMTGFIVPSRYFEGNLNAVTEVKVWNKYIIEKLRRMNDWLFRSSDATANVMGGSLVYIPQAGTDPVVEVNSNSYPGTAVSRTDSDVNYALDIFRTVPHRVPWAELQAISYDKLDSVLKGHTNTLAEAVGDKMLINWAATTAGEQVTTTGSDIAPVGNQAGNRKGFGHKDLMTAMIQMNVDNVPKQGRVAIIDDNMYGYFYDELSDKQYNAFNQFANNQTGQLGKLHSFDVYSRSAVLNYALNTLTPNAYAAAQLATDNLASLCYHPDFVERAVGDTKMFVNRDLAIEYGDLMSAIVKFGGRKKRSDNVGVISIIQGQ